MGKMLTFVEDGQNGFDIGMDLDGRRLAQGKVALANAGCACARNERIRQRLSFHVFVVGASVNVDDVACAMFHGLHLCRGDQATCRELERGCRRAGVAVVGVQGWKAGSGAQAQWEGRSREAAVQELVAGEVEGQWQERRARAWGVRKESNTRAGARPLR